MSPEIQAVKETRQTASKILADVLPHISGLSETEIRDRILVKVAEHKELFPTGWYDPPPGGISVLVADAPYDRLKFDNLRGPQYWPGENKIGDESVTMVYMSPVERSLGVFGDIGFTLYTGHDESIRNHIRTCRDVIARAAQTIEPGMKFSDVFASSVDMFAKEEKVIGWMLTYHDPLKVNLGHTAPGSYGDGSVLGNSFEETREAIRTRRVYFNAAESFVVPSTCAFTLEARLTDREKTLPNTFLHVIVTFENGTRTVLQNFDEIYKAVGMDYML